MTGGIDSGMSIKIFATMSAEAFASLLPAGTYDYSHVMRATAPETTLFHLVSWKRCTQKKLSEEVRLSM